MTFLSFSLCFRTKLSASAEKESVAMFVRNLRQRLLVCPVRGCVLMGVDPGYRHGCKLAILSPTSKTTPCCSISAFLNCTFLQIYINVLKWRLCLFLNERGDFQWVCVSRYVYFWLPGDERKGFIWLVQKVSCQIPKYGGCLFENKPRYINYPICDCWNVFRIYALCTVRATEILFSLVLMNLA